MLGLRPEMASTMYRNQVGRALYLFRRPCEIRCLTGIRFQSGENKVVSPAMGKMMMASAQVCSKGIHTSTRLSGRFSAPC